MATQDETLRIRIIADTNNARRGLNNLNTSLRNVGTKFLNVGKTIAKFGVIGGVALAGFGMKAISMGADVEEMENKFNVVFDGMTKDVDSWSRNFADKVGRNKNTIKGSLADFGDLMQGMGMAKDESFELGKGMISLATDLASFNNETDERAIEAMTKALRGETDMAASLGLDLKVGTMEKSKFTKATGKAWKELDRETKAQIYFKEATKQSANAIGDAERSTDSYTGQLKAFQAKSKELAETLGKTLLPYATKVLEWLVKLAEKLEKNMPAIEAFVKDGIEKITEVATTMYTYFNDNIMPVLETFYQIVQDVASWIIDNWAFIEPIIVGITGAFLVFQVVNAVMAIATGVMTAFGVAVTIATSPVTLIILAIFALIAVGWAMYKNWDKITTWFGEKWEWLKDKAKEMADKIGSFFGNMFNGAKAGIKSGINWIIDKINKFTSAFSSKLSVLNKIPGVNLPSIPKIPRLASGGIVTGSTLATVGEAGSEAVIPLSNKTKVRPFAQAVADAMNDSRNNGGNVTININKMNVRSDSDIKRIAKELESLRLRNNTKRA